MDEAWGVAGADTHKDSITFAVLDSTGADVALRSFEVTLEGVAEIITWLRHSNVEVTRVGIEGSAGWGLPVSKALVAAGFDVREVNPARTSDRRRRRRRQKTDSEDALAVAREVLADAGLPPAAAAQPVSTAHTEISVVAERRRTLIRRRQRLLNEAEAVLSKLPLDLRAQLGSGTVSARLRRLASLDADGELVEWLKEMLDDLLEWERRVDELEERLPGLLVSCGSTLTKEVGIGVVSAAELVAQVGDPSRFRSEGAFARWAGIAPVATSSGEGDGEPVRHRLDLLGNRTVNRIIYVMSVTQARHDDAGKAFLARKRAEGKTGKEARRAHKRQLANRVIRRMWADHRRLVAAQKEQIASAADKGASERVGPSSAGLPGDGGRRHPHCVRPARRRRGGRSARLHRRQAGPPVPGGGDHVERGGDRRLCLHRLPHRSLEEGVVDEPARTGEQGDQAPHQRGGHLPQRSRGATTGRIGLLEVHDEWQIAERRYLSESSMAKLYENDNDGADTKEVGANTKELLAG